MNVQLKNLRHSNHSGQYCHNEGLDIPFWAVESGEQMLICGLGGSGKTTLMTILAGEILPDRGEFWLNNQAVHLMPAVDRIRYCYRNIGYVPQIPQLLPNYTLFENMRRRLDSSFPQDFFEARIRLMLSQFGLERFACAPLEKLTPKNRLLAAIACALINMPRLILADEPAGERCSTLEALVIFELLLDFSRSYNATLIVGTTNPMMARNFDRAFNLHNGRLEEVPHAAKHYSLPLADVPRKVGEPLVNLPQPGDNPRPVR